mgnify:FL=1|jgi:hypothetical protein
MHPALNVVLRIVAVFGYQCFAVIGGAAIISDSIPVHHAALLAGLSATAQVVQKLAAGFIDDGVLDSEEINAAFGGSKKI